MKSQSIILSGKKYTLDEQGFLNPSEQWDENFAEGIARHLGTIQGLSQAHWDFIRYLRKKFNEEHVVPVVVLACADNGIRLSEFRNLFPNGYHRGACRIAGINYEFMYQHNIWLTYETTPSLKTRYDVTSMGFLKDFNQWDERFALLNVSELGMTGGLTDRHREIINYLREYYTAKRSIPTVIEMCRSTKITLDELGKYFPGGYRRGACRLAGLPFFP